MVGGYTHLMKTLKWMGLVLLILSLLPVPALQEGQAVPAEAAYFSDAVFVGDSVTNQLRRYAANRHNQGVEVFGGAGFLSAGAYSLYLASLGKLQPNKVAPTYRGQPVTIPDGLVKMEAKKVFIMLGLADAPGRNPDQDMYRYEKLVRLIREALPGIQVVAVSVTPMTEKAQDYETNQKGINLFNTRLEALCQELGIQFLDVSTPLKNEHGFLTGAYSNDKKMHLNEAGIEIYVESLYAFARGQLAGNPE